MTEDLTPCEDCGRVRCVMRGAHVSTGQAVLWVLVWLAIGMPIAYCFARGFAEPDRDPRIVVPVARGRR